MPVLSRYRFRHLRRHAIYALAVVLVVVAVLVGSLSQLLPLVERHPENVAAWLSAITGVSVAATAAVAIALVDVLGRGGDAARWIVDCVGALSTSVGEHSGADMRLLSGIVLSGGRPWGSSGRGGSAGVCSAAEPAPMSTPTWPGWSDVASPISTQW